MPSYLFTNLAQTALTGSSGTTSPISGSVETWTVVSSSAFPAAATGVSQFAVNDVATGFKTEVIMVTNVSGTTWTVTRGAESTTPIAHIAGATVQLVTTAAFLNSTAGLINHTLDWVNAVQQTGADPTGAADSTTAINNAITAAGSGVTYLPAGTYLVNSSTALAMSTAGARLTGDGPGATIIKAGSAFTAAEVVAITANTCTVDNLAIIGANSGNSALGGTQGWNGIELTAAQHCAVHDVFFQFVNGYAIETLASGATSCLDNQYRAITGRNCAAGIHDKSVTTASFNGEHFYTDLQFQQMGTTTGPSANLDAFLAEDVHDVEVQGINVGVASGTGHAFHAKGAVSGLYVTNADIGGGSDVVLIEDSGGNSPAQVRFANGTFQSSTAGAGLHCTGAGGDFNFEQILFRNNQTDGCTLANTGVASVLTACRWNVNNQSNVTAYDLNLASATGKWQVNGGVFGTTVGSGAGLVTNPVNDPNMVAQIIGAAFLGTSTTPANTFAGAGVALLSPGYSPSEPWLPSDNGLLLCSGDPAMFTSTVTLTAGTLYLARWSIRLPVKVTNIVVEVTTGGTGASTQSFVGLYNSAGTLLSGSADVGTALTSTGRVAMALTTPQTLVAGQYVWAAIMTNLATTQPTLVRNGATSATTTINQTAGQFRFATNSTLLTALPSPLVPGSNVATANALLMAAT